MKNLKYELIEAEENKSGLRFRARALKDFGNVKEGELSGLISNENCISQEGNCWVHRHAKMHDNARIFDNASLHGWSMMFDNSMMFGESKMFDDAKIYDDAKMFDNAKMYGKSKMGDESCMFCLDHRSRIKKWRTQSSFSFLY